MKISKMTVVYDTYQEWHDKKHINEKDFEERTVTSYPKTGEIRVDYVRRKGK